VDFWIELETNARTPRADLSELRIFFDFNPPALVIRQMPVKHVQFVQRHRVKNGFDFGLAEKMTAHVEHESTPLEARPVLNLNAGYLPVRVGYEVGGKNFRRQ